MPAVKLSFGGLVAQSFGFVFANFSLFWFVISAIGARGARFFALAWALRRYGDPIREFIERRLGLLAAIVAGIIILLYIVVKYSGIAGSITTC